MPTDQSDGKRPRVAASIPPNQKYALDVLADARSSPGNRTYLADLIREGVKKYLEETDLPEEARDALDEDLIANAGGTEEDVEA